MTPDNVGWSIPLHGPVAEGQCVRLGWPEEREFDAITALRNRASVRRQFLDPRPLDAEKNRHWLRQGMKRPLEALLAVRLKADGVFVGTIGWSHGDPIAGSIELGRVMVDTHALRPYRQRLPIGYPGVAVDAGIAVRDFGFSVLGLHLIRMVVVESNRLSLRAAIAGGARIVGTRLETHADGSSRRLVDLQFDRDDWADWKAREPRIFGGGRAVRATPPGEPPESAPIPVFRTRVPDEASKRVQRTLDSGWLGYGPECRALERAFIEKRGGWSLATSSCTSALYLAGRLARKLAPEGGAEVLVPAISFVASAMAFAQAGLKPVIVDVDPDTLLLDIEAAERAVTDRTRALVVVHLYGQRHPHLGRIRAIADAYRLLLVEDCAHRVDLLDPGPPVGDLACYSFNAVKELPAGEGGLIWGRDLEHEAWVRAVSNLGLTVDTMQRAATLRHGDYTSLPEPGLKLRSNDVAAALVNASLETLAACRAQRRAQAQAYDRWLAPLAPHAQPLSRAGDDSFLMYVIRVRAHVRERLRRAMAAAGVATSVHYPSLARHPLFGDGVAYARCADQDQRILTLPAFLGLDAIAQGRVVHALEDALAADLRDSVQAAD
ncbi:MAG TPA: GNAT family N-acetyltransferase [Casimicrobiaceae bacterium]|nr:GNAT family N-acetyltransferase [Casimicrobiaceae bacterium]